MPRGPKGEKRPADVIGNAVHVMRITTGEIEETIPDDGKDPAAKAIGKRGGEARGSPMRGSPGFAMMAHAQTRHRQSIPF
jgi:hypothetical protein